MEKPNMYSGYLPGQNKTPEKQYVEIKKKKKINPKDIFIGYKQTKNKNKK
tara:strand:+ start:98 stop:247 length:150 start_codon:yes stop_codon:yes gene_type:complete